jgi:hypothetical protein
MNKDYESRSGGHIMCCSIYLPWHTCRLLTAKPTREPTREHTPSTRGPEHPGPHLSSYDRRNPYPITKAQKRVLEFLYGGGRHMLFPLSSSTVLRIKRKVLRTGFGTASSPALGNGSNSQKRLGSACRESRKRKTEGPPGIGRGDPERQRASLQAPSLRASLARWTCRRP